MALRIKRDLFTGEMIEEEYAPSENGRQVIARESIKTGYDPTATGTSRGGGAYRNGWTSTALAVPVEQMEQFQKVAPPGVHYFPADNGHANVHCETKRARNALLEQRNVRDNDAGYGDYCGH